MNHLEAQYQEILYILDRLLANLGLVLEDYDVEYLTQADLYIEIFKIMFPVLEHVLNADFGDDVTDEELIQYLINVLAKDIIKMDLGHIRGELIAQGDAKSILNFLQLLYEISNMVAAEKGEGKRSKKSKNNKKLVKSSGNSIDDASNHSQKSSLDMPPKYHSAQGIEAEFSSSAEADSNTQSGRESYGDENGNVWRPEGQISENLMYNKAMYEQQKNMKGGHRYNSRSVSRISEVSKSKESSEYDHRGTKKLSQKFDDFNPAGVHIRALGQEGGKYGSYTSDDIRELRGENGDEEEEEEGKEEELEEYEEEEQEDEYELKHGAGYKPEYIQEHHKHQGGEEDEELEEEDQYQETEENQYMNEPEYMRNADEEEEDEILEEDEEGERKISGAEDVEYYANDPINWQQMGKGNSRQSYEAEREVVRRSNRDSEEQRRKHMVQEQEEEYYGQEGEEYEGEEEEEEERQQMEEEEYEEMEGHPEHDPAMEVDENQIDEVVEEHDEDNYDEETYDARRLQEQEQEQAQRGYREPQQVATKTKGKKVKGKTKSKAAGKKKASKTMDDYSKGKVQYRPLRPPTAGMKSKNQKTSDAKKSTGRTSNKSSSTQRSKKLVHSKSERNLNLPGEEPDVSQSQNNEDYSEERVMEPKEQYAEDEGQEHEYQGEEEGVEEEQEGREELGQIPDGNVFKILSDNVVRVKENLRENRPNEDIPFDDEYTVKMILKQKNQYKQYLKDFMKDHQLREKKYETMMELGQKNFLKKMRSEKVKDENMRREFENQQKSLYFKMRDEKVNYLRKVHKTIFELEKKRIIEDKKEYIEFRKTKNMEAQNMIDSIKNEYKNKLSILRERNTNQQHERKIANEAQRAFIQSFEKELKMDQMREVERLRNKWRHEKEKFDMMIKDEGFLERKIMELYKNGHF